MRHMPMNLSHESPMIDFAKFESTPIPSRQFVSQSHFGAKVRGVYGILFDCGQLLLECSGWLEFDERFPVCMDGFDLLYVGASLDPLRRRVLCHLTGNTRTSSLRMTVGAILSRELELEPTGAGNRTCYDFGAGEARLTEWLVNHTRVGLIPTPNPFGLEKTILRDVPLPFNISERRRHPYSKFLMAVRAYFAGRPKVGFGLADFERLGSPPQGIIVESPVKTVGSFD